MRPALLLLLLSLGAGAPEPPRDRRALHSIFRGLADAFGYDIRLKNSSATLPPPAAEPSTARRPQETEPTTQGYTGSTATDSELVPPFKVQGGERDDDIFGAGPTESYRPREDSSGEQQSNTGPPGNDGANSAFGGSPTNFGGSYVNSFEGHTPTFHGNDPYYRSSDECRGCSETEERRNEKIFANTDEHKTLNSPAYSTPNWGGFWGTTTGQGRDTHVGYNDYQNIPTEAGETQTESPYPREEENYVASDEEEREASKYKQAEQDAPSHEDFSVASLDSTPGGVDKRARTTSGDGENTQETSEEKIGDPLPTQEQSVNRKEYSERLPIISTFKPKLLHALEEVEGSKQNIYVPPPFDDSFENTDSFSIAKSPKAYDTTTPTTYSSTANRSSEKDTTLAIDSSEDKVNANPVGSISPWHPSEEQFKPKESQNKNYHYEDPYYPRPFTHTQAIFHDQPSANKAVNESETSASTTPLPSTAAYLAIYVPLETGGSQESRDITTKLPEGYAENPRNREFDHSSPQYSAYRYDKKHENPIGHFVHPHSWSSPYTQNQNYKNDTGSSTKHSAPLNSSSSNFVAHKPQNASFFPSFAYAERGSLPSYSYTPELAASEEFSAAQNISSVRPLHNADQHTHGYPDKNYYKSGNSSNVGSRELSKDDTVNKYDKRATELLSASEEPSGSYHPKGSSTQAVKSEALPSLSPVESSTLLGSDSDKYAKLETFSTDTSSEGIRLENSSKPNTKQDSTAHTNSEQHANQVNSSNVSPNVLENQPFPSENPYQHSYKEPFYDYSKLSVPPSVIPLHYPYEGSASHPRKEYPVYVYHCESNQHYPSYTSPERESQGSGYKYPEHYYASAPDKVYEPYVYSEDSQRPSWDKLGGYFFNSHPQAANNTYSARYTPQNSYYPSQGGYGGPFKITFGSGYESPPGDAVSARESQDRPGANGTGHGGSSGGTPAGGGGVGQGQANSTRGHLQRHPTLSADVPGAETTYEERTSAPSQEELHYRSLTIPPPTAYQPLESLERVNFWEQDERRPENLKFKEWESSVSTLSVMSTSTSYPETARKKKKDS